MYFKVCGQRVKINDANTSSTWLHFTFKEKKLGKGLTNSNVWYVTQSCTLPTMLHCSISNSLIQEMILSSVSKLIQNTAQSQITRKIPTTYAKTGLTALFIFPKVARPSSSLRQFSASTAGFSSLSAAEGEEGGPMRLEGKRNSKHKCKNSNTGSKVKQNRFLLRNGKRTHFF